MSVTQSYGLGRQPARVILVDLTPPFDEGVCGNLSKSLEDFMSLICSLNGPCRVPFFGLIGMRNCPEILLPIQNTKGNFCRIQSAIRELESLYNDGHHRTNTSFRCSLSEGLKETAVIFNQQANSLLKTIGYWPQLEITIFTCCSPCSVTKQVEKTVRELDMNNLKKVHIVYFNQTDVMSMDVEEVTSSQSSENSGQSDLEIAGIIDVVTVENDPINLQYFFRSWLKDSATDKEHLHLTFKSDESDLTIKCDVQERVLNPVQLPLSSHFFFNQSASFVKPCQPSLSPGSDTGQKILSLKILQKFPRDSICESLLFGIPIVVKATSCWKIDWDELEKNQQNFLSICSILEKEGQVLLAQLLQNCNSEKRFRYQIPIQNPKAHFLIFPSPSSTLLIKSVAVQEFLIPCDLGTQDKPTEESLLQMEEILNEIPEVSSYNPLQVKSGLHQCLVEHLSKNAPRNQGKRKPATARTQVVGPKVGDHGSAQTSFMPASVVMKNKWPDSAIENKRYKRETYQDNPFYTSEAENFPTHL